ncbi:hypothetical protein ACKKBG_A33700 [Auxenochlorella protothecoides x Auxenochlorella symbiontica]
MGRRTYSLAVLAVLIILSGVITVSEACESAFIALPSAILGSHVEFLTDDSATAYCKRQGFSKAGSVRTSTLNILGLSMDAVRMSTAELVTPRSTKVIVAVECLKPGQTACTADSSGNIGSGNRGKRNFGTNNVGDDNIGNRNTGSSNWGDNNKGTSNRCFDKVGDRKVVNDCKLTEFLLSTSQAVPSLTQAVTYITQALPSPTQAVASPPQKVASPSKALSPPTKAIAFPAQANPSPAQANSSPAQAVSPPTQAVPPPTQAVPPSTQAVPPSTQAVPPSTQAVPPSTQAVAFPTTHAIPSATSALSPPAQRVASPAPAIPASTLALATSTSSPSATDIHCSGFATATTMDTDTNLQLVVTLTKLPTPPTPATPACAAGYTPVNSKGVCDDSTAVPALCYDGNYAANAAHCTTGPSDPLLSCSSQVYPISVLPSPTGTMTWNGLNFNYAIDTGSYIASSLTLVTFASDNTVLGTYAAKPTSTVTERTATALPVVAKLFAYAKVSATVVGPPKQRSDFVLLTLVTTHYPPPPPPS